MKVTTSRHARVFKPLVLSITLESKQELLSFYHRMNATQSQINVGGSSYPYANSMDDKKVGPPLWRILAEALEESE